MPKDSSFPFQLRLLGGIGQRVRRRALAIQLFVLQRQSGHSYGIESGVYHESLAEANQSVLLMCNLKLKIWEHTDVGPSSDTA